MLLVVVVVVVKWWAWWMRPWQTGRLDEFGVGHLQQVQGLGVDMLEVIGWMGCWLAMGAMVGMVRGV